MKNYDSQWTGWQGEATEGHPARKIFRISTYPEDGVDVRGMMSRAFKYFSRNSLTKINSIHDISAAELIIFASVRRDAYQYSTPSDSDYKYTSYRIKPSSQKPKFEENESETHKRAQDIFKQWCGEWSTCDTNVVDTTDGKQISWGSSCFKDAWLEYPIVKNEIINSVQYNWDECRKNEEWGMSLHADREKEFGPSFIATCKECIRSNLIPIAIIDVVLPGACKPKYFVEICHTNPVSDEKLAKLEKAGMRNLIEIDADWIMSQTAIPSKIKIKRWLL